MKRRFLGASGYADKFDDFIAFIAPRLKEAYRDLSAQWQPVFPY